MKAFLAIVLQTMRSAIRAKVFHVLFALIIIAVFLLPMTVSGDGTAMGLVQIALTYSLGIVVALISTTTLWLSCSQLSREIEAYNVHLVLTKPCPKWKLWLAKWTGIFVMHTVILIVSAAVIYAFIQGRVKYETAKGHFSKDEIEQLNKEIRIGRRAFYPEPGKFDAKIEEEYARKKDELKGQSAASAKAEIRRQLVAKDGEVAPGDRKVWTFRGVSGKGDTLYLRYRVYSGSTSASSQVDMPCIWGVRDPSAPPEVTDPFVYDPNTLYAMGGSFHEIRLSPNCIDKNNGHTVQISFVNPPAGHKFWRGVKASSAVFQSNDGPVVMVAVASFFDNYCRAILLAIFQLAFLTALGCTVSSAFSTPVAAFVAVTYLVIGLSVQPAIDAPLKNDDGTYKYKGFSDRAAHYLAMGVGQVVVSVDDLDATSDLARGRLVEGLRLTRSFFSLLLFRTGMISAIGIWILTKREMGAVIRK